MDYRKENKIVNIIFRVNFNYMPLIPLLKKEYKPTSHTGGTFDTWYAFSFHWLFIEIKPAWKYQFGPLW